MTPPAYRPLRIAKHFQFGPPYHDGNWLSNGELSVPTATVSPRDGGVLSFEENMHNIAIVINLGVSVAVAASQPKTYTWTFAWPSDETDDDPFE